MTVAGEHADALVIAPAHEAEAVVLDLIDPLRAGRHHPADGREAWFDEARRMHGHGRRKIAFGAVDESSIVLGNSLGQ
jgi:hypothetical protein